MSEDVNAPELRAQDAFEAKINRRPPREKASARELRDAVERIILQNPALFKPEGRKFMRSSHFTDFKAFKNCCGVLNCTS